MAKHFKSPGRIRHILYALLFAFIFNSCKKDKEIIEPVSPIFQTGPATFVIFGGVVQTFQVLFENLGNVPIEEYGVIYSFKGEPAGEYPDITSGKVVFQMPAKTGANEQTVQIGFPARAHHLSYRAYTKLKDTELVKYAEPIEIDI